MSKRRNHHAAFKALKGERPDYERLLKIVGEDKLRSLLKRIEQIGYQGLPAVVGAAGIGCGDFR